MAGSAFDLVSEGGFDLGDLVRDTATGFTGVLTAVVFYLGGSTRVCVESAGGGGGERWVELSRVESADEEG